MDTLKLYSPLEFYLHDPREEERNGEYGMVDLYDKRYIIPHDEAWERQDALDLALLRDRDRMDAERGLAEYLPAELREKIRSLFPDIEYYGNYFYCAATAELTAPLTEAELAKLKDWWSGQLSDGWGESFEQRELVTGREVMYVVPWWPGDMFYIDTEREFRQRLGLEPRTVHDWLRQGQERTKNQPRQIRRTFKHHGEEL